jgi:hypothetical protein
VKAMITKDSINLHFEDSGRWYSLPEWAEYFIKVGKSLTNLSSSDSRVVTAIVVPTRAFGAAFVSLGMVISDAASRDRPSESAHFERLFDLPPGTSVVFRPAVGRALKGIMQPPQECGGKLCVRVQVHSQAGGGLTYILDESRALQVQPARGGSWKLPKRQGSDNVRTANKFVDGLLGEADAVQLGVKSKCVCAIVGRRNVLEHEIRNTSLAIHVNGCRYVEGLLQEVVRINRFVTPQQSYRSALIPVGSSPPSTDIIESVETAVVFDGAVGFLRWGGLWRSRHQVVILDRTESYFDDAVSAINARYAQSGLHNGCAVPDGEAPVGSEILAFREALQ